MNTQKRVARALAEIIGTPVPWDELNREARSVWRSYATATIAEHIAALAETGPTEAMTKAAMKYLRTDSELNFHAAFQAAFEALEAEPPEAG